MNFPGDVGPNAIPSTFGLRVEVVTSFGSSVSTSSNVVWTSSNPGLVTVSQTGILSTVASASFQGNVPVTITASTTSNGVTRNAPMTVLAGNTGTLLLGIQ